MAASRRCQKTIEFILDFSTGLMTGSGKLFESRSVQIGGLVFSAEKGSYPCKQRPLNGHHLPEDDASGDYQLNLGPRVRGTSERQLPSDASGTLPHPL